MKSKNNLYEMSLFSLFAPFWTVLSFKGAVIITFHSNWVFFLRNDVIHSIKWKINSFEMNVFHFFVCFFLSIEQWDQFNKNEFFCSFLFVVLIREFIQIHSITIFFPSVWVDFLFDKTMIWIHLKEISFFLFFFCG